VRVTAQLIAADRDEHLWADTYDRVLEDVFAVQSDVAENIARALHAELTPGERERLHRKPTENLEAYDLCLKGLRITGTVDPESLREAERYFHQATALDPGYARAYAGLAMTLAFRGYVANVPPAELFPQLRAMANEAIRLDPGVGEAHAALASLAYWYEWDWAMVERELETALELNPDQPFALAFRGFSLTLRERFAEAEVALREALRLDPHYPIGNVVLAELRAFTGRPEEGIAILDAVLRRDPQTYDARLWRGICQLYSGNPVEAASDLDKGISMVGRLPIPIMLRGVVHAVSGETERARQILEELRSRAKEEYVDPYCLFSLCYAIDGFEEAFPYLEQMLDTRSFFVTYLRATPRYRELRSEPRFMNALRTVCPEDF
jgi:tetratricopeptide (TPR) repeat protein